MHEWALAYAVAGTAIGECAKKGVKRATVSVLLGELQQIDQGLFLFALKEISEQKNCGLKFKIKTQKAVFRCRACGKKWGFSGKEKTLGADNREFVHFVPEAIHSFSRCPKCGSRDFEVEKGRGVLIEKIRAE